MAKSKAPKYPKTLAVMWAGDDPDDQYLDARVKFEGHAEKDDTVYVAEYAFVRMRKVVNRTTDETTVE